MGDTLNILRNTHVVPTVFSTLTYRQPDIDHDMIFEARLLILVSAANRQPGDRKVANGEAAQEIKFPFLDPTDFFPLDGFSGIVISKK